MENLVRYRAMESLCRQSAVFRPLDSWRLLAEAEMWHHKAEEEIDCHYRRVRRGKKCVSFRCKPSKPRHGPVGTDEVELLSALAPPGSSQA